MDVVWFILGTVVALIVWGLVFDLRRRRRDPGPSGHDVDAAARRARGAADAHGGHTPEGGGAGLSGG